MKREVQKSLSFLAFAALILFVVSALLSSFDAKMGFFIWVGNGMLLFVVLCLAYFYVKGLSNVWKVIYLIIVVLSILSYLKGIGVF